MQVTYLGGCSVAEGNLSALPLNFGLRQDMEMNSEFENQPLVFLTWNLCLLQRSADAPIAWTPDHTEAFVREFILDLDPDIVFFQELPGQVPYVETHDLLPANTKSHSGVIATLVRNELIEEFSSRALGRFAVLAESESLGLTFANVHLAPFADGTAVREHMASEIIKTCKTPGLIIVGDTNTRVKEEENFAKLGLAGARPSQPTWDTKRNSFRRDGPQFTSYFTRFFHNDQVMVSDVQVWDKPAEWNGCEFFLSDHFALSGEAVLGSEES